MLTLSRLDSLADRVKISPLAESAGIHRNQLAVRKSRGEELTADEVAALATELRRLIDDIRKALK